MDKNNLVMLYVEDDEQLQNTYTRFFKRRVKDLHLANNGSVGLEKFKEIKPDIVVSDLRMPIMDGIEMIQNIRELNEDVTVIVTSAFNDSEYLSKAIELGVSRYLNKPFKRDQISKIFGKAIEDALLKKRAEQQRKELEAIFKISTDGIAVVDKNGKFENINQTYLDLIKYTKEGSSQISIFDLTQDDERADLEKKFKEVLEGGVENSCNKSCFDKNGNIFYANIALKKMNSNGKILVRARDTTKERIQNRKLEEYFKLIDENIISSMTDLDGNIIEVSKAFCKTSGYSKKELIGKNHKIIKHPDNKEELYKDLWQTIQNNESWTGEFKNIKKSGEIFWTWQTISPIFDLNKNKIGYTSIKQDITDKKRIEKISITDKLTGIYNRTKLDEILEKLLENCENFSIAIADIDKFKSINDTYGHQAGDSVLVEFSRVALSNIDENDFFGRWGGEEFLIIFKNREREEVSEILEKIRGEIEKHNFSEVPKVTASFGGTKFEKEDTEKTLFIRADENLYKAKNGGRNRVVFE
ncbi:PAS domain S-box/diguanylate cyclase (GGDEF) domain-containing protein [Thiovulum sp. ES]|nr:PAS domain S-box/diguanylate cyclase (GGDEF) domain-containing protein [Thiovulum sp. ES]